MSVTFSFTNSCFGINAFKILHFSIRVKNKLCCYELKSKQVFTLAYLNFGTLYYKFKEYRCQLLLTNTQLVENIVVTAKITFFT